MHVAYFFLGQLVPETYKAGQGIKNTQQPVPETFKEGRGKNYEERNIVAGRSKNFRQIKRIREDGETKKQRNHSLYNRNQNEGQIGRGVADCCYFIPRPQRYFLIYFPSLANNCTSVNFFY
jgi:hypothetical protein